MVEAIFSTLTDISVAVMAWFGSLFNGVADLFYDSTGDTMTLLGTLALIGVAVGAFYFILRWIMSLIQIRTKG